MTLNRPRNGPDWFTIDAYGAGIPGLITYALDHAQRVYGDAARLRVAYIGPLSTVTSPRAPGPVTASVLVHCGNYDQALDALRDRLAEGGTARLLGELAEFLGDVDPTASDFGGRREEAPRG